MVLHMGRLLRLRAKTACVYGNMTAKGTVISCSDQGSYRTRTCGCLTRRGFGGVGGVGFAPACWPQDWAVVTSNLRWRLTIQQRDTGGDTLRHIFNPLAALHSKHVEGTAMTRFMVTKFWLAIIAIGALACAPNPAQAQHGGGGHGGGGGFHGGGGGGLRGGGSFRGGGGVSRGGGIVSAGGAGSYRGGLAAPRSAGGGGAYRPEQSFVRPSGMNGAGANRGLNAGTGGTRGGAMGANRGQADGQWHSFGAPGSSPATGGTSATGTARGAGQSFSANSESRGSNFSAFSGNRAGASGTSTVRSWSGEGHNIVETTARPAANATAVSRAAAGPVGPVGSFGSVGSGGLGAFRGANALAAGGVQGRASARQFSGTGTTSKLGVSGFGMTGVSGVNGLRAPGFVGNGLNRFGGGFNFPGRFGANFGLGLGFRRPYQPFRFGGFGFGGFGYGFGLGWGLGWPGCGWDWPYGFCGPLGYGGLWPWPVYGYPAGYGYGYDDGYYAGDPGLSYDTGAGYGTDSGNANYGNPNYNNGGNPDSNAGAPPDSANPSNAVPAGAYPSTLPANPNSGVKAATGNQANGPARLYFKGGTEFVAGDYWVASDKLHYVGSDGVEMTVDFDQLNLQKTIDENAKVGVRFWLKSAPAGSAGPTAAPEAPGAQDTPGNGIAPNAGNNGQPRAAQPAPKKDEL